MNFACALPCYVAVLQVIQSDLATSPELVAASVRCAIKAVDTCCNFCYIFAAAEASPVTAARLVFHKSFS